MNIEYLDKPKLIKTYTINSPIDEYNIILGKCPNYALNWGIKRNLNYWPTGHDFISGKYCQNKNYLYPKTGVTISEYERIKKEKTIYEKYISTNVKELFKKKREILKKEMNYYLST